MSEIVTTFDPSAAVSGAFPLVGLSNGIGKVVMWNESNWLLDLEMPDGSVDIAPAWTAMIYHLSGPGGQVSWTQDTQLVSNQPPISKVWVIAYRDNEQVPGVFPLALVRQATVGNALNLATTATGIQNDGNIAGTNIVESTVSGDIASAVSVTNAGDVVLGTVAHNGSFQLANGFQLFFKDANGTLRPVLTEDGSNQVKLRAAGANNILFQDNAGATLGAFDGNGLHLDVGTLALIAGSLSRMVYTHIASVSTTAAFVNHNLGVVPDFCILIANDGTLSAGNFTAYYDSATMTTTQVKLQSNSVSGIPVGLIAIKL